MARNRSHLCAYCGTMTADTADHVIGKCLFLKPRPEMVTVPACTLCNAAKSPDDTYLRDMLVIDIGAQSHPTAKQLAEGAMLRATRRRRSEIGEAVVRKGRVEPFYFHGIYIGDFPSIPIDPQRVTRIFHGIVKGLFYRMTKQIFPSNSLCEVRRLYGNDYKQSLAIIKKTKGGCNGPYRLGDVFECWMIYAKEDAANTWWIMSFYGGVHFGVMTEPTQRAILLDEK